MASSRSSRSDSEVIGRAELVRIVSEAAAGITESTRAKLLDVARTTEAVSVGWWHCDGVSCPARQARRKNQEFQTAFDRAMAARYGRVWDENDENGPIRAVRGGGRLVASTHSRREV